MSPPPVASERERLRVGLVLERRRLDSPWQEHGWTAVAVVPGAPDIEAPLLLAEGEGFARYHFATLEIELHRSETEGYRYNLSQAEPVVYALWRQPEEDPAAWPEPFHLTVCPYEAQDYLDGGDVLVEGVSMPEAVALWLGRYVARHHVDAPFEKRQRRQRRDNQRRAPGGEDEPD
ncbi:MAG: DUF3305 domain-containing protein [Stellaceae bacterium]